MGFPYIQPLNKTVVDKLKKRESNPLGAAFKYPFVVLSSPAIVTNDVQMQNGKMSGSKIKDLFDGKGAKVTYYGCKIKNETDPKKLYPTGATALGYDFKNKTLFEDVLLLDRASRNIGDKILISGPTTGNQELVVEKMFVNGSEFHQAKPGDKVTFALPFRVRLSDKLFKIIQ